jgi:two-component system sensor histidine kinase BaeS
MKTLFSRILLAQVLAVLMALVVVTLITRISLGLSFKGFLETQEPNLLQTLVPVFEDLYQAENGWDFLRDNPENWRRIWRLTHQPPDGPPPGGPPPRRNSRNFDDPLNPPGHGHQLLRWMRPHERGLFRDRLFLLDQDKTWVGGAQVDNVNEDSLQALEAGGQTVGWLGFAPPGRVLTPQAERFLGGQFRIMALSFGVALLGAIALSFFLARRVSGPVSRLGETVRKLSGGHFDSRVDVNSRDEIGALAGHVNRLAETLEKNRTARQRWMADIAHELRTPLAVLKGEVEALADGVRTADERTYGSLREEVDQLSNLVDDLQTLAQSDAGALNLEKNTLDLSDLVGQCLEPWMDRLATRGIQIDLDAGAGVTVMADARRLRQLMSNLLENTYRYVEENGTVRVRVAREPDSVRLELDDSGPGLEPEQIQQLFERFYRVDDSRSRSGGGSGLGLSICKNIVEAHGGQIRAEPSELGGLGIRVRIPA